MAAILISMAVPAAANTNVLPGGGFESLLTNEFATSTDEISITNAVGNGYSFGGDAWTIWASDAAVPATLNYGEGNPWVAINRNTSGYMTLTSAPFSISRGVTYRLSFDYRSGRKDTNAMLRANLVHCTEDGGGSGSSVLFTSQTGANTSFHHVEVYFTCPTTRSTIKKAQLQFMLESKPQKVIMQNLSMEVCDENAVLWYKGTDTIETNAVQVYPWYKDTYGYSIAHVMQTNSGQTPVLAPTVGNSYTVIKAIPVTVTGDADAPVMILAQYKGTSLQSLNIVGDAVPVHDEASNLYIQNLKCENITVDGDADTYKAFYWQSFGSLIPKSEIGTGNILAQI